MSDRILTAIITITYALHRCKVFGDTLMTLYKQDQLLKVIVLRFRTLLLESLPLSPYLLKIELIVPDSINLATYLTLYTTKGSTSAPSVNIISYRYVAIFNSFDFFCLIFSLFSYFNIDQEEHEYYVYY